MSDLITIAKTESHSTITMDDGKANALSFAMFDALNAALDEAEAAAKPVVLAGRPGKFSAGFDLSVMAGADAETMRLLKLGADLAHRVLTFKTPVVLAVSGHALAMGALLCLSADYRIGMRGNYKIGLNETAIGMTLPWFGVELARSRLAKPHFPLAVNLARIYDGESAVEAGFVDEVADDTALLGRAEEMAQSLASLDMGAHHASKLRVRAELLEALEAAVEKDFAGV